MTLQEIVDKAGSTAVGWGVAFALGGLWYLIRRIFTNQQMIKDNQAANERRLDTMESDIRNREALRQQDRDHYGEKIDDLKAMIHETRDDVKKLFQRN